jgi:DNA-binding CsgD family transcriptional regulator
MQSIPDYRLTMRIKNNRILKRIESAGYESVAAFCQAHGLNYQNTISLVAMRVPAKGKRGEWSMVAVRLAGALNCLPDDLFNERQIAANFDTRVIEREIDEPILSIEDSSVKQIETDEGPQDEYRDLVKRLLDVTTLTPREHRVIVQFYGLGSTGTWTPLEIAAELGVSRHRVDQITRKALRKLHSKATKGLGVKTLHRRASVPQTIEALRYVEEPRQDQPAAHDDEAPEPAALSMPQWVPGGRKTWADAMAEVRAIYGQNFI